MVFSGDTDLVPALEFVVDHKGGDAVESAIWKPEQGNESQTPAPIGVSTEGGRAQIARHTIDLTAFSRFAEKRNFNQPYNPGPAPGQSGRRLPPNRR